MTTEILPLNVSVRRRSLDIGRLFRRYTFGFALLLVLVLLIANLVVQPSFGWTNQLADFAPLALAAMASTPAIISGRGGFDLTISPSMTFSSSIFIVLLVPHGLGGIISVPIILLISTAIGALNGTLIVVLRVPAVVVTLAMYFILIGVDEAYVPNPATLPPGWVNDLRGTVLGVPAGLLTIALPLVIWGLLRLFPFYRILYAVGSNHAAAFSSGINVDAVRIGAYALGGLFAGIGAFALTGLVGSVDSSDAASYTLVAIAGVALGGTSLHGGRGGLFGAILGGAVVYLLQSFLSAVQVSPTWLELLYGGTLVFAIVVGAQLTRQQKGRIVTTLDSAATGLDAGGAEQRNRSGLRRIVSLQERMPLFQIVGLLAIYVYGGLTLPGFFGASAIRSILLLAALAGLAALGETLLILMGGFDLSVAGIIVAGGTTALDITEKYNLAFAWGIVIAVVGAGLLGAAAGQICHRLKIPPLIVTLGTGAVALGLTEAISDGYQGSAPEWLTRLASPTTHTFGLPIPPVVSIWIVMACVMGIFLHRTVPGRRLMATGANPLAAENSLIHTRRVWTAAFAFSAIVAALLGILLAGYAGSVDGTLGNPYLFQAIACVVVGGTVFGGPGDYTRTVIGALFLTILTIVLVGHGASEADEQILYGVVVLVACSAYGRERRLRDQI